MSSEHHDTVEYLAQHPDLLEQAERIGPAGADGAASPHGEPTAPEYSEDALALTFTARYAADARYTSQWGRWHWWAGAKWQEDRDQRTLHCCRGICREAAESCPADRAHVAKSLASAMTTSAVERLARCDRRHAALPEQWDAHPMLLNTPTGTIELETGGGRENRRQDYLTKITAVGPGGDCPTWLAFLARVTADNDELQAYLARVAGYCLTGSTEEHALFFLYGTGSNGKSTFVETLSWLLGDYARVASMETFTATGTESHPTDLAGLQGARLVTAIETEDGRRWAESKLKALTGGDRIAARFMRQDFFTFTPQFKLLIAGNHKPGLRNVDEAMRRRLNLIPFVAFIPPEERDGKLGERLRAEGGGIIKWALRGCREWQAHGLSAPAIVREATEDYLAAEDSIGAWVDECCLTGGGHETLTADLYESWAAWCEAAGQQPGSKKRFSERLESRGFARRRIGHTQGRGFADIRLRK